MVFCTSASKFKVSKELIDKLEDISDKQPQYVQLQFDFMKDFENGRDRRNDSTAI